MAPYLFFKLHLFQLIPSNVNRQHVEDIGYCASSSDEEDVAVDIDLEANMRGFDSRYNPVRYEDWEGRVVWQDDSSDVNDDSLGSNADAEAAGKTANDVSAPVDDGEEDDEIDWEKDDADSVEAGPAAGQASLITIDTSMMLGGPGSPRAWGSLEAKASEANASAGKVEKEFEALSLRTELNADLGRYSWLNAVVWDDLRPPMPSPSTHWLIVNENDTSIVSRMVEKEKDKRPRMRDSLADVDVNGLHLTDETDAPTQRKQKGRKTREEKARGRDARLARLRAMGLLFDENEQRNDDAARTGQPLDASLAWKAGLPKLPDAVRLQSSKPEMKPSEAQHFHRPRARYSRGDKIRIFYGEVGKGGVKKSLSLAFPGQKPVWKKKDLTARDGSLGTYMHIVG